MTVDGFGRLEVVHGMIKFLEIHQGVGDDRLKAQFHEWFPDGETCFFMKDGAPYHNSKVTMTYLNDNEFKVLPWPGNSPDPNPIRTLWAIVKIRLSGLTRKKQDQNDRSADRKLVP